ncbi:MAG: hypothetical protein M1838_001878 [Thelocarpon superellum]|nr:MAG: hypothetical protein M1838_001878 [Thelocarpon superellum]
MAVTEFQERVFTLLSQIPAGRVSTYAAISNALHSSPRAVGNACGNNPFAPEVPCHRCITSTGTVGGYLFTPEKKLAILKEEGVDFDTQGRLLDKSKIFTEFKI